MNVTERSRIKTILRRFPSAEDAFGWYGIEVDGFDAETTVDDIAREFRMDVYDLVGDLQAHIDDAKKDRDPDDIYEDDDDDDDDYDDYDDDETSDSSTSGNDEEDTRELDDWSGNDADNDGDDFDEDGFED